VNFSRKVFFFQTLGLLKRKSQTDFERNFPNFRPNVNRVSIKSADLFWGEIWDVGIKHDKYIKNIVYRLTLALQEIDS